MIRVAFCCHGNICRSTLSESVFTHKVNTLGLWLSVGAGCSPYFFFALNVKEFDII